jgi:phage protein D
MEELGLGADTRDTSFHVPGFRVTVGGKELSKENADVVSLQFKDSIKDLSAFEITLNNWDDSSDGGGARFKYSDDDKLVALGHNVEIEMGYHDAPALVKMMVGQITAMDPQFPAAGGPTIVVRGVDRLHYSRNAPQSEPWKGFKDSQIAEKIAVRLGMKVNAEDTKISHAHVAQHNQDDVAFLHERAKRINYEVYVRDDVLQFVKTREGQQPQLKFVWGKSLVSFTPSLTLARQVSKVTVRAWHPKDGRLIEKTAERGKLSEQAGKGKNAAQVLQESLGGEKEEIITNEHVSSDEEAERLAAAVLASRSYAFITGQGQSIGLPALRAGINIELSGLGRRFDGNYYVTDSSHRIDGGGYTTSFNVRKVYV